ncbi:MAG: hypothetical protein JSS95_13110 [Acidobacteria bacterium]|nr:hypothetical protein [Acidobacteriota bacterium]
MMQRAVKDSTLTLCALGALACMVQSVLHEGLGHGVAAWLSGAHTITVSSVAMDADIESRWIEAAGTLVNLAAAALLWIALRLVRRGSATVRYLLVLMFAGNLFSGTGYFLFSGFAGFGDWNQIIRGLHPYWLFRLGLVVAGVIGYAVSMVLVARELRPFAQDRQRLKKLTWTPYFAEAALAAFAGLFNPAGPIYVLLSALPATMGANSGLLWIRYYVAPPAEGDEAGGIGRSYAWFGVISVLEIAFIFFIGRGWTWHR